MGTPFTARESRRRRRFAPSARGVSDPTLFTALTRREASRSHLGNQRFRPIQPLRHLSLATVVGRKSEIFVMTRICDSRTTERRGRPMARPVSVRAPTVDGRPMQFRTLCKEIPRLCRDAEPATPLGGLTYRVRTGVRLCSRILPPLVSGPARPRARGNPGVVGLRPTACGIFDPALFTPGRMSFSGRCFYMGIFASTTHEPAHAPVHCCSGIR